MFSYFKEFEKVSSSNNAENLFVDFLNFAHDIQQYLPKDKQVKLDWLRFAVQKWLEKQWKVRFK